MNPDVLAHSLQEFLSQSSAGVVIENGERVFDLDTTRYSVSSERGKCLLHLWSEGRSVVRRVLASELKSGCLRLTVRGLAKSRPHRMVISRDADQRSPALKKVARQEYAQRLAHVLAREFPGWTAGKLMTSVNLERSFSPVYARGILRKGRTGFAVLGVNQHETQASVDAALTFGLLWLEHCRRREVSNVTIEGLRLFLPASRSNTS